VALPAPALLELDALDGAYVNHYRFGAGGARVVYYGGAVSRAVYEERRQTAPTIVAEAFAAARAQCGVADVDLIVSPCPLSTGDDDEAWVSDHLAAISERVGDATALATVGYSAGARLALSLAVLEDAPGAARFGGAGVAATLVALEPVLRGRSRPLSLLYLMNAGDPLGTAGTSWAKRLGAVVTVEAVTGPGQHPFADYVANGFAARAFAHALAMLRP
jgi:hypothetical protein